MRPIRPIPVLATALLAVALSAAPASAGGATWAFDGTPRDAEAVLVPGERVRATTLLWLDGVGSRAEEGAYWAGPQHGPFYGYISTRDPRRGRGVFAPPLPPDALRIGEVRFEETKEAGVLEAVLEFVVPQLEPGYYALHHCNDPCTRQIGDTWTTPITIAADRGDALLARDLDRLDRRLDRLQPVVQILRRRLTSKVERLNGEVESLKDELARFERSDRAPGTAVESGRIPTEDRWPPALVAFALALVVVGGAGYTLRSAAKTR